MTFFALKMIALLSMLVDHVTYVFPVQLWPVWDLLFPDAAEMPQIAVVVHYVLSYIGRIAAPVFLFSLANGYRHTKDVKRYALRLFLFACLAEWPYYLLFECHGNILFTLLIGLLTLWAFDHGEQKARGLGWAAAAAVFLLLEWLGLPEGHGYYILFILAFYLTADKGPVKRALLFLILWPLSRWKLLYYVFAEGFPVRLFLLNGVGPLLGVGLTLCCNGQKGPDFKGLKYLWYVFYPAHLLILGLLYARI